MRILNTLLLFFVPFPPLPPSLPLKRSCSLHLALAFSLPRSIYFLFSLSNNGVFTKQRRYACAHIIYTYKYIYTYVYKYLNVHMNIHIHIYIGNDTVRAFGSNSPRPTTQRNGKSAYCRLFSLILAYFYLFPRLSSRPNMFG